MPWLQDVYGRYGGDDLSIVGLTRVTRSATDDKVRRFLRENRITYPIVKEDGSTGTYFNLPGTPFMTVVRDGKLLWEHRLPTEQFPEYLVKKLVEAAN